MRGRGEAAKRWGAVFLTDARGERHVRAVREADAEMWTERGWALTHTGEWRGKERWVLLEWVGEGKPREPK